MSYRVEVKFKFEFEFDLMLQSRLDSLRFHSIRVESIRPFDWKEVERTLHCSINPSEGEEGRRCEMRDARSKEIL